jgi:EAL domain-containing protein (putative c-di-GMP-specific phosphodiesterase class I)
MGKRSRPARKTPREPIRIEGLEDLEGLDALRWQRILTDGVTGLTLHPFADLQNERVAHLGIIYLQLGRFAGVESLYGWEVYDRVLHLAAESLREDLEHSAWKGRFRSMQFTGSDGFYLLFDLSGHRSGNGGQLSEEAARFRHGVVRRLRQALGRTAVDLMSVHTSSVTLRDDPRVRPSRNLLRGLREAARIVESRENTEKLEFVASCKTIIARRQVHAVYQPVFDIRNGSVIGYEALIRGPAGSDLEAPELLFAAARESEISLELEHLCLETVFSSIPRAARSKKFFVNASSRLLTHAIFLDERNLAAIGKAHSQVVMEISEKEIVWDYPAFREVLDRLRVAGLQIAIDDAGSGYSGLESILQLRPEYIKVANSIVHNLHLDGIKREVIAALSSLGRQISASLIAEGIEQPEEVRSLVDLGIAYGQGFLLGKPASRIPAASSRSIPKA